MTAAFTKAAGVVGLYFGRYEKMKNKINLALKNAMLYAYASGKDYKPALGYEQARTIDAAFYLCQTKMCEQEIKEKIK